MSILKKMKTVKKRWYLLLIIVVIIGGSAVLRFNYAQYRILASAKMESQVNRQVDLDLVLLETSDLSKVTSVQAKEILPVMEKLSVATDLTVQSNLAKQVYGMLTPAQYSVLMDSQNKNAPSTNQATPKSANNRDNEGKKGDRGVKGGSFYEKGSQDPKEQALSSVVIKMLEDRSTEQIQPKS